MEAITLGQSSILNAITQHLLALETEDRCRHLVLNGPEGSGKSHLLAVLESRITHSPELNSAFQVIRFPEAYHRILSFSDFLALTLECLEDRSGAARTQDPKELLQNLRSQVVRSGKGLLVIVENLEVLCHDQFKATRDLSAFLTFLREESWCGLLASANTCEGSPGGLPKALLKLVSQFQIHDLSRDEFVRLASPRLSPPTQTNVVPAAAALGQLHRLCGGRARIAVLLQDILSHEDPAKPELLFSKLMDRLTPQLRARLAMLPPQERAVLEVLALQQGNDRSPTFLAAHLRMKQGQVSSLLRRLVEAGHICSRSINTDRRARRYAFCDPLLELWLLSGSTPHNRRRLFRQISLLCALPSSPHQQPGAPIQPTARPGARGFLANETYFLADLEEMAAQWCRERGGEFCEFEAFLAEKGLSPDYAAWASFRAERLSAKQPPILATERATLRLRCASLWSDIGNFTAARRELETARRELGEEGLADSALAGIVLNDLAVLLQNCELPAEAEPLIQRACEILATHRSAGGQRSPALGTALRNYHAILRRLGWDEEQAFATVSELEQRAQG